DLERNPLTLVQRLQSRLLDGGDVHEHVAAAVIRLDESVSAFTVEEFDRTGHRHRDNSSPCGCPPPATRAAARPDIRRQEKASAYTASVTPRPPRRPSPLHRESNVRAPRHFNICRATKNRVCVLTDWLPSRFLVGLGADPVRVVAPGIPEKLRQGATHYLRLL